MICRHPLWHDILWAVASDGHNRQRFFYGATKNKAKRRTATTMIARHAIMRTYVASILTLTLRGVLSPLSPVSHEVVRRSPPAMVVTVEESVSLGLQDV